MHEEDVGDTSRRGKIPPVYNNEGGENQLLRIPQRTPDCLAFTATSHKDLPPVLKTTQDTSARRCNDPRIFTQEWLFGSPLKPHRQQHAFKGRSNLWQTGGWLRLSKNPFQRVTKMMLLFLCPCHFCPRCVFFFKLLCLSRLMVA